MYIEGLPFFCAKEFPFDKWYLKNMVDTTSDGGDAYTKDDDFLKSCLLYTCLSNQNKCLSFLGSDGRMYQNELCLDNSRYEKAKEEVTQDGKEVEAGAEADADAEMLKLLPVAYQDMMAYDKLDDEEKERAKKDMGEMLDYIDKLNELDTEGVEPMSHVFPVNNVFREDVVTNGDGSADTLANAPVKKDGGFKVPKTIS